ncbi:MAG: winged helix-turn-helix domain-containing tetratricopeptide repeat protein [Aestuariivirgaceae bacterium]
MIYSFDEYEVDTDRFELRSHQSAVKIEPQVFALLELLVSNPDRLVTKDEINLQVWGGRIVSDAVVNSRMRAVRQAIGDDGKNQRLIRTVHGRGFRFVGEVATSNAFSTGHAAPVAGVAQSDPATAPAAAERPSIAVLPLRLLTPDERYGGLGDAVSQEIIVELSRLHWLFVIARGSTFRFRDPVVDLDAASRTLGAKYLLTGTIAFYGRTSAVTVELTDASDGRIIWADRLESPVDELLQLRLTISSHIVTAIEARIQMTEAIKAARLPTENLDAWAAFHRGLWHMYRFNRHDNDIAARMFERAIAADAGFARAYAGLSFTHFQNAFLEHSGNFAEQHKLTRLHADKSLDLDPMDPFVNLTMARAEWLTGDIEAGMPWLDRSIDLSPNYAFAIYNKGILNAMLGEGEKCQCDVTKAISLSPIDPLGYAMLATRALSHIVRGEYREAVTWAQRAVNAPNAHVHINVIAALACELAGQHDLARQQIAHVRAAKAGYRQDGFFRAFPFQDGTTRATVQAALARLDI